MGIAAQTAMWPGMSLIACVMRRREIPVLHQAVCRSVSKESPEAHRDFRCYFQERRYTSRRQVCLVTRRRPEGWQTLTQEEPFAEPLAPKIGGGLCAPIDLGGSVSLQKIYPVRARVLQTP